MTLLFKPHAEWWLKQVSALIKKQIRRCKFQLSRKLRISSDPFSVLWCFYLLGLNENYEVFVLYSKSSIQGKFYHNNCCCEIFPVPLANVSNKKAYRSRLSTRRTMRDEPTKLGEYRSPSRGHVSLSPCGKATS